MRYEPSGAICAFSEEIEELEKELKLREDWANHHKKVSEIDAQKKHDAEARVKALEEENKKLRGMIDNGLGWEDMKQDI